MNARTLHNSCSLLLSGSLRSITPALRRPAAGLRSCHALRPRANSMPSRRILETKVVRAIPNRAAAPYLPPTTHLVSSQSLENMIASGVLKRLAVLGQAVSLASQLTERRLEHGTSRDNHAVLNENSGAGGCYLANRRQPWRPIVADGITSTTLFIRSAYLATKCRTSAGISSERSRKGGRETGNTPRRVV